MYKFTKLTLPSGEELSIGANGNWYIGDVDTGVAAQGPKGDNGRSVSSITIEEV